MTDLYTTFDVASIINKDVSAVRRYVKEFGDYLSETATPEKGETRLFDNKDMGVLLLISQLKESRLSSAKVREALDAGDRGVWPPEEMPGPRQQAHTTPGSTQSGEGNTQAVADDKDVQIAKLKQLAESLKDERDYLRALVLTTQNQLAALTGQVVASQAPAQITAGQEDKTPEETATPENIGQVDEMSTEDETAPAALDEKPLTLRQRIGRAIAGDK